MKDLPAPQEDLFTIVHELIHVSLEGIGDDDPGLAIAALSFTGQTLDLAKIKKDGKRLDTISSGIWDNRLREGVWS